MKDNSTPIKIETQRLKHGGVEFDFSLSPEEFGLVEDPEYRFEDQVTGNVKVMTAGAETVLVTAEMQTTAKGICARCAEEITIPISVKNRFAWFLDPGEVERKREDDPDKLYYNGEFIDPVQAFREELMVSLPVLPKCTERDNIQCYNESQQGISTWTFGDPEPEPGSEQALQAEPNSWFGQLNDVKKKLKKS